jgi:hypothetical protein
VGCVMCLTELGLDGFMRDQTLRQEVVNFCVEYDSMLTVISMVSHCIGAQAVV